jgi:SAM-dependent methyltransferase
MSVAAHLKVTPAQYDRKIRTLIPYYDELLSEAAAAVRMCERPVELLVDLGIGTGALASRCLAVLPPRRRAQVWGIDVDASMMGVVRARLAGDEIRDLVPGSFLEAAFPECDAIVASFSFHHIRDARAKLRLYRKCHAALRPGGILINGDCMPSTSARRDSEDRERWWLHLAKSNGGSKARGRRIYESWADEDFYMPLESELGMLQRAGFATVDVPWRRSPFAVVAAVK